MSKYIKRLFAALFLTGGLLFVSAGISQPVYAQFDPLEKACTGAAASSAACRDKSDPDPIVGPNGIIARVANIIAIIAGIAAVILIVVYGIMIVSSYGESGKVTQARNAIIGVAAGLVVIILARTIVVFVVSRIGD